MSNNHFAVPGASLALLLAVVFSGSAHAQGGPDIVAKGRALSLAHCAHCHAITKSDVSQHPGALPFRVVVTRYPPDNLSEALAEGIVSGHPDMPISRPAAEIEAIVAYLNSLAPPGK